MLAESLTVRYCVLVWLSCDQPQAPPLRGASSCAGGAVPELDTVDEIDAALARARSVPDDERTELWHAIVDGLLEQRTRLAD
jgi:hypothetical protein